DNIVLNDIIDGNLSLIEMLNTLLNYSQITKNLPPPTLLNTKDIVDNVIEKVVAEEKCNDIDIINNINLFNVTAHENLIEILFYYLIKSILLYRNVNDKTYINIYAEIVSGISIYKIASNDLIVSNNFISDAFNLFENVNITEHYNSNLVLLAACKKIVTFYKGNIEIYKAKTNGIEIGFTLNFK
nr:hypothetical protein [Ferruginibacter sp.]